MKTLFDHVQAALNETPMPRRHPQGETIEDLGLALVQEVFKANPTPRRHAQSETVDLVAAQLPDLGLAFIAEVIGRNVIKPWQMDIKPGQYFVSLNLDAPLWVTYGQITVKEKCDFSDYSVAAKHIYHAAALLDFWSDENDDDSGTELRKDQVLPIAPWDIHLLLSEASMGYFIGNRLPREITSFLTDLRFLETAMAHDLKNAHQESARRTRRARKAA